ncbi:MAG: hypothetical protein DRR19_15490 [Candidatus Parabeggiatoa sp. nov. 1]|nr:MAG: hypothetical protein DRR19_15490 [Gammaproteobacteria bacterium]
MNNFKFYPIALIIFIQMILMLSACTSKEEQIRQYKAEAVQAAWEQERELVTLGHNGTREWNEAEKSELLDTGKVTGYEGRYIKTDVEDNLQLATGPNNIVFVKAGESSLPKEVLHLASLRSYLIPYEKNKYFFWGAFIIAIIVLIIAIKKKFLMITNPAIGGGIIGAVWFGVTSGGSFMAILVGLAGGLMTGVMAGVFMFLIFLSVGIV